MSILKSQMLENKFSFEVLLNLYKNGEQNKQTLYASVSKSTMTVADRVNELKEMGLIEIEIRRFNSNVHFVSLTEKGKKVAEKIQEIESILSEN